MNGYHFSAKRSSSRIRLPVLLALLLFVPMVVACGLDGSASPNSEEEADQPSGNRLALETSPYLRLHADNPVDWYPWGEEAIARAKRENKLIFLSVGYSSCYWCHVMERESFEDDEIADFLNEHFICIKVDREERPDVDSIYMTALQILTRRGGWPMSIFLMPDTRPFFGGSYFPARDDDRPGATGFLTVIERVSEIWDDRPEDIEASAQLLTGRIRSELAGQRSLSIEPAMLDRVQASLLSQYDSEYGGFGFRPGEPNIPKFPEASNLLFLLQRAREGDQEAADALMGTLEKMARGGIRDHIGGGFHRYSVDRFWMIPHFEKMLYDNGQLATVYAEAYAISGRDDLRRPLVELIEFVLREMTAPEGGFYSALDAESEHVEGKFYRWKLEELHELLDEESYSLLKHVYGLDSRPNFESEFYVLQLHRPLAETAEARGSTEQELVQQLALARGILFEARAERIRPLTDTKIITGWNGLMIAGLADAGRVLDEPRYIEAAERSARFVLDKLRDERGRLLRTYGEGKATLNAYVDDYAFFVEGLISLHRATGREEWLQIAAELTDKQIDLFWDEENGGFFFTSNDHEELIVRGKSLHDGALPSGNSVSAANLVYLAGALGRDDYRSMAQQTMASVGAVLQFSPRAVPRMAAVASLWIFQSNGIDALRAIQQRGLVRPER